MALNVISNFAANVAHRNLVTSDMETTRSLAKLSSGKRVLTARDDAASMAIGSRLRAEVAALQAARVNASQATSMLQVADGAMSQIDNILVRMKSLSIQASSSQYGDVERSLIDAEYQQLLQEITRIAQDTDFNGKQLLNGGDLSQLYSASDPSADGIGDIEFASTVENGDVFQYSYNSTSEILTLTKLGVSDITANTPHELVDRSDLSFAFDEDVEDDAVFSYSYDQTTEQFTVTNLTTGDTATIDVTQAYQNAFGAGVTSVPSGESLDVDFNTLGLTVTFEQGFDFTAAITATTSVTSNIANTTTAAVTYATGLSDPAVTALQGLPTAGVLSVNFTDGAANINLAATANLEFSVNGGTVSATPADNLESGTNTVEVYIDVDGDGTFETQVAQLSLTLGAATNAGATTVDIDFNQRVANTQSIDSAQDQSVEVDLTSQLDALAGAGNNLAFDQELDVNFQQFGVTVTLDKGFDRTSDLTGTIGSVGSTLPTGVTNASFAPNTIFYTADLYQALLGLGYDTANSLGYDPQTGILSLQVSDDTAGAGGNVTLDGLAGLNFGYGDGNATGDLTGTGTATEITIALEDGSTVSLGTLTADYVNTGGGILGTIDIQLGRGVFFNQVDDDAGITEFTFKIGTGNEDQDDVTINFNAVDATALGLNGLDVLTQENAETSSEAITEAITVLSRARANIGALQNRLDIASSNLAVTIENTEAARSQLLDLDVAEEMTVFTSKQILMQAGVSMLAQANQLPQNLLRLFQ